MPMKMTIEIIKHSDDDLRIIVNDNGKRFRHRYYDCVQGLASLSHLISSTTIYKDSVYLKDDVGNCYPVTLSEWFAAQLKPCITWRS